MPTTIESFDISERWRIALLRSWDILSYLVLRSDVILWHPYHIISYLIISLQTLHHLQPSENQSYVSLNLFTSTCLDVLDDGWNALGWILSSCSVLGCILRSWGLLSCILSSWSLLGWILGSWSLLGLDSELLGSCKFKRSSWFLEENNNTIEQL